MRTTVQWAYQVAHIDVNMPHVASYSDAKLDEVMIHELLHVHVHEMRQWEDASDAMAHEERVVTGLTNAIQWAMQYAVEQERERAAKKDA